MVFSSSSALVQVVQLDFSSSNPTYKSQFIVALSCLHAREISGHSRAEAIIHIFQAECKHALAKVEQKSYTY